MFYIASQIAFLLLLCAFVFYALGRYVQLKAESENGWDSSNDLHPIRPVPKEAELSRDEQKPSDATESMPRPMAPTEELTVPSVEVPLQVPVDDSTLNELTVRLAQMEELIQNLKLDSEIALLSQIEFQENAGQTITDQSKRSVDLEHELELRITQTDREIAAMKNVIEELNLKIEHFHEVSKKLKELIDATRAA